MIISEHKLLKRKEIIELKLSNHQKNYSIFKTFNKLYLRRISRNNQKLKNENNKIQLMSLLSNNNFIKDKSDKNLLKCLSDYNSYSPYISRMENKSQLTKYVPSNMHHSRNKEEDFNLINNYKSKNKKKFFGLDPKTSLYSNDSLYTNSGKIFSKSPSTINYNKNDNSDFYTIEDDIISNKIYLNKKLNLSGQENEEIDHFLHKYSIETDLTYMEKMKIKKEISSSKLTNNKNCFLSSIDSQDDYSNNISTKTKTLIKEYNSPYHSQIELKINSQIHDRVEKMREHLHFQRLQEQFSFNKDLMVNKNKVLNIRTLKKKKMKKIDLLKRENVINFFNQKMPLNKKKIKVLNYIRNYEYLKNNNNEDEKEQYLHEEKIKKIRLEIGYLSLGHHPDSRLMSSICYDKEEKKIYNYGGIGGIFYGDLWECQFSENKILWKRIYNYPYNKKNEYKFINAPLPRYGQTCHFYKRKVYIVGGEYKDWKKEIQNEEIIWIYDIERREWYNLTKYEEIKNNKLYLLRRHSKIVNLKLELDFSDPSRKTLKKIKNAKINKKMNKSIFNFRHNKDKDYSDLHPCLRRNHVSVLIGSHILIYGGLTKNKEILNDCWIYDLNLNQWTLLTSEGNSPPPLAHHCCCLALEKNQLINDTFNVYHKPENVTGTVDLLKMDGVFFFGGLSKDNKTPSNLFFHMSIGVKPVIFDVPKIKGNPPRGTLDASMDFSPNINMIIIYGGRNELDTPSYYDDMTLLDLRTLNWIQPAFTKEKPINRAQHLSIVLGDELIIFGGSTGNELLNYDFMVVDLNLFK
mgnify:CR=1 FL=1